LSAGCAASTQSSPPQRGSVAAQPSTTPKAAILILHRAGSASGRQAAQRIAAEARRAGIEVAGIAAVPIVPKTREVRYLRSEDAFIGERLASRFYHRWGKAWQVREAGLDLKTPEYVTSEPIPAHTLEVWLSHR
jgi:hypothetical protein